MGRSWRARVARPLPDPTWIHTELRRAGVTLELLHLEYLQQHPDGYRYSAFCRHYRAWLGRQRVSMRQVHKAGDKLFVDYSGKKPEMVDAATGVVRPVELFVAVLGASNYTYAEATETQRSADFIRATAGRWSIWRGVPAAIVPDQLKPGVRDACRYEPILQRTYEEWAAHYGTVILPARPAKPRDKAKVEVAVQVAQRWILARLRHETFFSLAALNARIRELLADLNARPMKGYGGQSRRDLFLRFDQPALRPLPAERFVYTEWRQARVNIDYHIDVERHFYSVPHRLIHQTVDVRLSATTVEVFQRGTRLWVHAPSAASRLHDHPRAHAPRAPGASGVESVAFDPVGRDGRPADGRAGRADSRQPAAPGAGLSVLSGFAAARETVRARSGSRRRAVAPSPSGARSYRHVEAMLKHGLDRLPLDTTESVITPPRPRQCPRAGLLPTGAAAC